MLAHRPGCQGACSAATTRSVDAGDGADPAGQLDGVGPAGRPARHPTSRTAPADPASTDGDVQRLVRQRGVQRRERLRRPGVRSTAACRRPRRVAARQEHRADLEHQQVAGAARKVAQHGVQQSGQQGGAHQRAVGVQRVGQQRPRRRRLSSGGSPSPSSSAAPMNGKDSTSVSPAEARSAAISRSRRCAGGQPGAGRRLRQHRRRWCRTPPAGPPPRPGRPGGSGRDASSAG